MSSAYNESLVYNLEVIKQSKRWFKHDFIEKPQLESILNAYPAPFYHPNLLIRILLFVATLIALSGVTGFLALLVSDTGEDAISIACIVYGIVSFFILEKLFIGINHYKSGITEAILYHSCGFTIGGLAGITDFDNMHVILWSCLIVFSFSAIRYLDLLCTIAATGSFAGILFFEFYNIGGIFQQIIPFVFIVGFTPIYFLVKRLKQRIDLRLWRNNLLIVESISLLLIYAAGNYMVVRELSVAMMNLEISEGGDIPFAFIFYTLTALIPIAYLYFGIKNKDIVLLRVSLIVLAFSAFTFKFYFSLGHPEITLTLAGIILIGTAIALMRYLKTMRNGFTRENIMSEKWGSMNVEAFVISQTMGGNQPNIEQADMPGGGASGGGGASSDF
jgi:hypothetical protein